MALIKCSECGKDISNKASTCPNCGNPINPINVPVVQIATPPGQNLHIEPELTSKTWKKVKLWAWGIIISAFILGPLLSGNNSSEVGYDIFGIVFLGVIVWIVGSVGAWYADKRTR